VLPDNEKTVEKRSLKNRLALFLEIVLRLLLFERAFRRRLLSGPAGDIPTDFGSSSEMCG
jgi:hypothetical protein